MPTPLLIRGARQVLTLRDAGQPRVGSRMSDLAMITDGSVLIDGSIVKQVGATRRMVNLTESRGAIEIDASGCIVLPGLVDAAIELFSENYTAAFVTRMMTSLMASGTTTFRCEVPPRKAATLWESVKRSFPDSVAGGDPDSAIALRLPVPLFTRREGISELDSTAAYCIGTGFHHPRQPVFSMQTAISLATLHLGMTVEQAIAAATTNAAHAIGVGDRVGSLEPGKQADLLILSVPDYREIPYHLGVNLVRMVIKRGRKMIERGARN